MSAGPHSSVLRHIRRIAHAGGGGETDDARLLERFVNLRDEAAFETLLKRHGPMVLGVCRRLLRDPHSADDAFQAVFLVLLRKAGSIRKGELLANWLYGVAYRTALRARCQGAWRQAHEKPMNTIPGAEPDDNLLWRDLRPILDEELHRLPDKYRRPIVLCYLEGKSFTEAACELGWPAGTVAGRLARARKLLQSRLTRRGVTLSAAMLGAVLSERALAVAVPPPLFDQTLKAALLLTAGSTGALSGFGSPVVALAEGVLQAMYVTRVKIVLTAILALGILTTGAGVVTFQQLGAQQPAARPAEKAKSAANPSHVDQKKNDVVIQDRPALPKPEGQAPPDIPEEKLQALLEALPRGTKMGALLKDQLQMAETETMARWNEFLAGRGTLDIYLGASQRLLQAERDLSSKRADQIAAFEAHWQRTKFVEDVNKQRYEAGRIAIQDYAQSRFNRIQAEIWLERAKAGVAPRPES